MFFTMAACSSIRDQERRDMMATMTTDQKVDYLSAENEKLSHEHRQLKHKVVMAKFFPHMFFGR